MFYQLPPAGNPVLWRPEKSSPGQLAELIQPFQAFYFHSGAESLAVALQVAVEKKAQAVPEVLLPAYACPELVSAVLFAGAKPVLVDLQVQSPWMDLQDLKNKINANTVAVIAVNLFGIAERLTEIQKLTRQHDIFLIEDSAQAFPDRADQRYWQGDFVILSFGRGKPASVLGGGAVLAANESLVNALREKEMPASESGLKALVIYRTKIILYNLLLHPRLYFYPASMPWLKLGDTRFNPMMAVEPISRMTLSLLDANTGACLRREYEHQQRLSEIIDESPFLNLPAVCNEAAAKLIRYPLLVQDPEQRDSLYRRLMDAGLGASKMYQQPLNRIAGLEPQFQLQGCFSNAQTFADSLITLPVHPGVRERDFKALRRILLAG